MHHVKSSGVYRPHRVGMMLECSIGELFARAAYMHHADQGDNTLKHCATLKWLMGQPGLPEGHCDRKTKSCLFYQVFYALVIIEGAPECL